MQSSDSIFKSCKETIARGHRYRKLMNPYRAKAGSHDDGPAAGLFLGGIGTPVCSRDLNGSFARWHLEAGIHVRQEIDEFFLEVSWSQKNGAHGEGGCFRLNDAGAETAGLSRSVHTLFPVTRESYGETLNHTPLRVEAEFFSPLVPGDSMASTLPVWYVTVAVENVSGQPINAGAAVFLPNFLGWRNQHMTPTHRSEKPWPSQTHSGNTARGYADDSAGIYGVIQERFPERPVIRPMEGEIALLSHCDAHSGGISLQADREICFKAGQNVIDRRPEEQKYTIAWAEDYFARNRELPGSEIFWTAHWDEALGSAVSRSSEIAPGDTSLFEFCLVFDLPLIEFGSNRRWYRKYTGNFGTDGRAAAAIGKFAAGRKWVYRKAIDVWHSDCLNADSRLPVEVRASMLNELYFINGGGSVWVSGTAEEHAAGMGEPLLGSGEHTAILEGFDIGYYYYNTSDLWPYAWYGISRWWPEFSDLIFKDYLASIPMKIDTRQIIYRTENLAPVLNAGKLPHDLGSPMGDPWHDINGYQMRDDSNLWKDHNPGFIVSFFLHKKLLNSSVTSDEWAVLREAGDFVLQQIDVNEGLPVHDEFGDSTWDNLGIRGRASYSGSLILACAAVMIHLAEKQGEQKTAGKWSSVLDIGQQSFINHLWNGEYFKLSDAGRYAGCLMPDGIIGFYFADLAGLSNAISKIDRAKLISHLKSVYRYNFKNYENGNQGPLLVAGRERTNFPGDGGDELQVNEVLVGSAWMCSAMMHHYGLIDEGNAVASTVQNILHKESGLQFRTPAAYSSNRVFRAPMNLRPLSIWFLDHPVS